MEVATTRPPGNDLLLVARERIRNGPVPEWVSPAFASEFKSKQSDSSTCLLLSQQVHAELNQTHVHVVERLENMQGVQDLSQWRLPFEPLTMSVTIHWIRIRRGNQVVDQGFVDRLRLLQREERLEGCIIDGWITLLLLLEDVRPGDLLDACYTLERQARFLPENCSCFFTLPGHHPVGKFHFSLRFRTGRMMKWKSSATDVRPLMESTDKETLWNWSGAGYEPGKLEDNIPEWYPAYPWLQLSDCADWGVVSRAIANGWKKEPDDAAVRQLANEIAQETAEISSRIEKAIRLIQDEYRYLSLSVELGGRIPSPPGEVVRRRFGDCKDLSFLLVHLLDRLGIPARPILVDTGFRRTVSGLLPTPNLFNHVVVEYELHGQKHWVDATLKHQGGNVLTTFVPEFGVGLPVDPACSELVECPPRPLQADVYDLKETILLDTSGDPSLICIFLRAKGCYAEHLRQQLQEKSEEEFAKERLESCVHRFSTATRSGRLEYRDDRAANEFTLVEVFEIDGFLSPHDDPDQCRFIFPGTPIMRALVIPEPGPRKAPFALSHPCNLHHTVEIQSPALKLVISPRRLVATRYLHFGRSQKSLSSYCSITSTLSTFADYIEPEDLAEHREALEEIWKESSWEINVATGFARPRRRSDFGELPPPPQKSVPSSARLGHLDRALFTAAKQVESVKPAISATSASGESLASSQSTPSERRYRKSSTQKKRVKKNRKEENLLWPIIITVIIIVLLGLFIFVSKPPTR